MRKIYTDGSCLSNPGPGGWAFAVEGHGCYSHGKANTTNNEMELTAIVKALKWCSDNNVTDVEILSDSNYCIQGATKWVDNWVKRHWRTSSNGKVKNEVLWKELLKYGWNLNVKYTKVLAHSGIPGNEFVDKKAREQAEKFK
tara:strand:+ start:25 stop:450 length:426 start_codon:yes stop_codon:yes gene_type:complete